MGGKRNRTSTTGATRGKPRGPAGQRKNPKDKRTMTLPVGDAQMALVSKDVPNALAGDEIATEFWMKIVEINRTLIRQRKKELWYVWDEGAIIACAKSYSFYIRTELYVNNTLTEFEKKEKDGAENTDERGKLARLLASAMSAYMAASAKCGVTPTSRLFMDLKPTENPTQAATYSPNPANASVGRGGDGGSDSGDDIQRNAGWWCNNGQWHPGEKPDEE